ncbi:MULTISPECIES: DUF5683 domain-containing protein [Galbibacter]|uniref:DUF5683 domain-containing protein n=1 Tax=Galbibacter pacificus TaxID=2996052 RepID=A0ABT6FNJ1_9FLAO|nr:DUF5683 domain-containing protein [Galbibacter pacificus]MDG3581354.1 DUF5683 domain-containing protein [Galbibacter pacificus]MDG3584832.1 DUF5683 domain-containing protein [Galbibacter pacificus]
MLKRSIAAIFLLLFHFYSIAQEKATDSVPQKPETEAVHEMTQRELRKLEKEAQDSLAPYQIQDTLKATDTLSKKELRQLKRQQKKDSIAKLPVNIDPLSPAKAAFYSAILPGLGQIYNKSYWKVPIVYGAIGTGVYFYIKNTQNYNQYRDAYKRRLAGFTDDEFYDINNDGIVPGNPDVSDDALRDAQEFYQQNRDLSLLITIGLYALNIIDANVDAHLKQFNVNEQLSLKPYLEQNQIDYKPNYGVRLSLNF